jgi:hypothetical protein
VAADSVSSSEKGKLLYQGPEHKFPIRVLALLIHILLFIIGILLNILIIVLIIALIVLIFSEGAGSFHFPTGGDFDWFRWFRFGYLPKRVRIYEKGITEPLGEIKGHLKPKAEGRFIPFKRILAYEYSTKQKRCEIIIRQKRSREKTMEKRVIYENKPRGVVKNIRKHLHRQGIEKLPADCPKCKKALKFGSHHCPRCKFDRFSVLSKPKRSTTKISFLDEVIGEYEVE